MINTHTIETYTIDDHPNKDLVIDWVRNNWTDLGESYVDDAVNSLKGFCDYFDLSLLDYSIGIFPDQNEGIRAEFVGYYGDHAEEISELSYNRLRTYLVNNYSTCKGKNTKLHEYVYRDQYIGNCPFTGVCYDETLLDEIRNFIKKPDDRDFNALINDCFYALLHALHADGEYIYSDEGITELCQANEYEFNADGSIY
jgi:hypothetical protein